ncbi:MAG: GatB/YqeY domain-containing protein [Actinomycetota bacterium]
MTDLKAQVADEMKRALKAGEKVRLAALRLLAASAKNREVELGHELSDEEYQEVVAREVKRRKEAVEAFEQAGRQDLVDREREEQAVLEAYLPEQLSEREVDALVDQAIEETGASGPGDIGKVMGWVMGKAKGRVDGATVSARVKNRLSE